jgi:hypothetical protein
MGELHETITDELQEFIAQQHMFFVATAPLSADGHVNLSPKGYDSFRVLSHTQVAYLDMTGSGNETSAHLLENGRITFMFCSFDTAPRVLRLYGKGRTVLPNTPEWEEFCPHFAMIYGARQIIVADIERVHTACGFAVPFMEYQGEREALVRWAEVKCDDGLETYHAEKNFHSIDGLPTPMGETR